MKLIYKNKTFFIILLIIILYQFLIQNGIEKMYSQTFFDFNYIKRPNIDYNSMNETVSAVGMPSGHAEIATIVSCILYFYKYIPFWLCILIIFSISLQRIVTLKHTLIQVVVGIICGLLYSYIYISNNLTLKSFGIVLLIGLILIMLIIFMIDKQVYTPIPKWVDKSMISSIQKKQNSQYYFKFLSVLTNSFIQERTFVDWNQIESYLDILISKIKKTGIHFDCVVGIKTGGAIISDYVSKKLNIPNYKVKLTRSEYNCNKNTLDSISDIYYKRIIKTNDNFDICETINENLEGKNIILIDELISSGSTMKKIMEYLYLNKKANIVHPCCISVSKESFKYDFPIDYIINDSVFIWAWGYEN